MWTLRQLLESMSEPLTENKTQEAMASLPGWGFADDTISKTYRFSSFTEAIGFITEMAFACERANHHPELTNVYSTVTIRLSTHDAGGKVTEKDIDLARKIEKLAKKRD
jgi:4a-hydroxytetrahydrobiopterin dehydratase